MRRELQEQDSRPLLEQARPGMTQVIFPRENSLARANLLAMAADWRPPLLVAWQGRVQDSRLQRVRGSLVRRVRARRCWQGPGPCASSLEKQVVRKCNRAARCGGHPTSARYRR